MNPYKKVYKKLLNVYNAMANSSLTLEQYLKTQKEEVRGDIVNLIRLTEMFSGDYTEELYEYENKAVTPPEGTLTADIWADGIIEGTISVKHTPDFLITSDMLEEHLRNFIGKGSYPQIDDFAEYLNTLGFEAEVLTVPTPDVTIAVCS